MLKKVRQQTKGPICSFKNKWDRAKNFYTCYLAMIKLAMISNLFSDHKQLKTWTKRNESFQTLQDWNNRQSRTRILKIIEK